MEILNASQMRSADRFTIENVPISSLDLMERAAARCFDWIEKNIDKSNFIHLFCGPGNNGGDGLALARMLYGSGYEIKATLLQYDSTLSPDCLANLSRLQIIDQNLVTVVTGSYDFPKLPASAVIIDALFGTGLSRDIEGEMGQVISKIHASSCPVISIDVPSGIRLNECSLNTENNIIKAFKTLTFQYPKLALLVAENAPYYGSVEVLDIGLKTSDGLLTEVHNFLIDLSYVRSLYVPKREFSHKGNFGHGLLITGEIGKMGAAVLAAGGFLRSGAGLLTLLVPDSGIDIVQTAVPEAMVAINSDHFSEDFLPDLEKFTVVGMGPGIGTGPVSSRRLRKLLDSYRKPMVLDADALNILSSHPEWQQQLQENSILTPHPGEFKRLVGPWLNDFDKLEKQRLFAQNHRIYLILKGKNTTIACPDGKMYFNSTGNAGMAKGGSGDVLTGLLTGILASGYSPRETAILGVWLHGIAGDLAALKLSKEGMKAGDLIEFLPEAWQKLSS